MPELHRPTLRAALAPWLALFVSSCTCAAPARTEVPTYRARHARAAPTIDGDFSEWSDVPATERFVHTMSGDALSSRAVARMQWDERALYVAIEIEDSFLSSRFTERDEHLWEADCVELMIDRGGDGVAYAELQVSPSGVVFDTWFTAYRAPQPLGHLSYSAELETAVATHGTPNDSENDTGYDVEMAIPWAPLTAIGPGEHAPPHSGEEWRVALYVLDLLREGATASAWSPPMVGDFHVPLRFGRVVLDE